jgi:hypothetical protein
MIDAEDPIPPEEILLLEAFEYFYRCSTPNWADLQYRLNPREKMGMDEEQRRQFRKRRGTSTIARNVWPINSSAKRRSSGTSPHLCAIPGITSG